jgi:large subunit GTPase 1
VKGRNNFLNFRKGAVAISSAQSTSSDGSINKPWKGQKREKREKLRRKYAHLDQH